MNLEEMLKEWDDPNGYHEVNEAEDIIHALRVELSGKDAVIKELKKDVAFYKRYQTEKYEKERSNN